MLLLLCAAVPALAHDYWLEPSTFFPAAGDAVDLRLFVGEHFKSEAERPLQKQHTVRFEWIGGGDTVDLMEGAKEDQKPIASVKVKKGGTYLAALERGPSQITLEADKFNAYLKEEGLDEILEQRRKSGEAKAAGRERYRRYLKALLQAGDALDDTYKKDVAHRLEIVPQSHPAKLKAGEALTVKVLFDGKPLAGARLNACRRGKDDKVVTQSLRTSKEGLGEVKIDQAGPWLVRLVYMQRTRDDKEIDWESFWSAYAFAVRKS